MKYITILALLCISSNAYALPEQSGHAVTVPITATAQQAVDLSNGVITGIQPIQTDVTSDGIIYDY